MKIHVYHHCDTRLDEIFQLLQKLERKLNTMSAQSDAAFTELLNEVTAIEGKTDSIIALVEGLAQLLEDNPNDPAFVLAVANRLKTATGKVTAAIEANPLPTDTPPTP